MKNDKKNKLNMSKVLKFLFIFVIIYLLLRVVPLPFFKNSGTMRPTVSTYMETLETTGVIIKDEKVYYATNKGNVETLIGEGERAASGSKVSVLTATEGSSKFENELEQINKSINEIKNVRVNLSENSDVSKEDLIKELKNNIQIAVKNNKVDNIYILREQLQSLTGGETTIQEGNDTLAQLEKRREELFGLLHENVKDYYIDEAAMISYNIDGYENAYVDKDFEKYTYDKINKDIEENTEKPGKKSKITKEQKSFAVETDSPIFKTIDNFKWHLAIKIDDIKLVNKLGDKKTLTVQIDNGEELEGKIVTINKFKNKAVIILEFRSKLQDFYTKRFPKIRVIESNTMGFKIPKTSVIEEEKVKGVMVKDISGIARFRPIIILAEDEENVYVKMGDDNGYVSNEKQGTIRTINIFDEVFLKPKGIKDGKIID